MTKHRIKYKLKDTIVFGKALYVYQGLEEKKNRSLLKNVLPSSVSDE